MKISKEQIQQYFGHDSYHDIPETYIEEGCVIISAEVLKKYMLKDKLSKKFENQSAAQRKRVKI